MSPRTVWALGICLAAACSRENSPNATTDTASSPGPTAQATTLMTFDGVGRARIGTTATQLQEIGALPNAGKTGDASCRMVALDWLPAGVHVMLVNDTVVRIDADSTSTLKTIDGAGIGDTEARIHQLYARVETLPHKYVPDGHYLSVASPNDSTRRIVFETDGNAVKTYRVGRRPEVDFVERCG